MKHHGSKSCNNILNADTQIKREYAWLWDDPAPGASPPASDLRDSPLLPPAVPFPSC